MSNMETLVLRQLKGFSLVNILEALERQGLDKRLIVLLMVGFLAACGGEEKKDKKGEGETSGQTTQQVKKEEPKPAEYTTYKICSDIEKKLVNESLNRELIGPNKYSTEVIERAEKFKHMCNFIIDGKRDEALLYLAKAANAEKCYGDITCDFAKEVTKKVKARNKNETVEYCKNAITSIPFSTKFSSQDSQMFKILTRETCVDIYNEANKFSWSDF